jgi:hypothetical protein
MIAYLVMLVLIAKHLLADSYGPWDRLLEIGVFLFIAYEVIAGTVRHRRTTRRQRELKQIVTSLSQFMNTGRKLQSTDVVPWNGLKNAVKRRWFCRGTLFRLITRGTKTLHPANPDGSCGLRIPAFVSETEV